MSDQEVDSGEYVAADEFLDVIEDQGHWRAQSLGGLDQPQREGPDRRVSQRVGHVGGNGRSASQRSPDMSPESVGVTICRVKAEPGDAADRSAADRSAAGRGA